MFARIKCTWIFVLILTLVLFGCSSEDNPVVPGQSGSSNEWTQISGPGGVNVEGEILSFFVTDSGMFAGTPDGVFRSTDIGASWFEMNNGRPASDVNAFAVSGNNLFSGGDEGIYRSTDNGANWAPVNNGLPTPPFSCHAMTTSGTSVFVCISNGLYRSTDNGNNWEELPDAPGAVHAFAVKGTSIFAAVGEFGVHRSDDNGDTWTNLIGGSPEFWAVADFAVSGDDLYIAVAYGGGGPNGGPARGVHRSTDNGDNWTKVSTGLPAGDVGPLMAVEVNGEYLYAGTYQDGVYRSTDKGANWSAVNTGLEGDQLRIKDMAVNGNSVFAGTPDGICRSTDNGTAWKTQSPSLSTADVRALLMKGTSLFAGTYGNGLFRSDDEGASWTKVDGGGFGLSKIRALAEHNGAIYAGGVGGLCRSTNGGATWTMTSVSGEVRDVQWLHDAAYAICEDGRILEYERFNAGEWFTLTDYSYYYTSPLKNGRCLARGPDGIKMAGGRGASLEADIKINYAVGDSWQNIVHLDKGDCEAIVVYGSSVFAAMNSAYSTYFEIWRCANLGGGGDWTKVVSSSDWEVRAVRAMAINETALFAATEDGVYRMNSEGKMPTLFNGGLATPNVQTIMIDGTTLYIGTGDGGVWKKSL